MKKVIIVPHVARIPTIVGGEKSLEHAITRPPKNHTFVEPVFCNKTVKNHSKGIQFYISESFKVAFNFVSLPFSIVKEKVQESRYGPSYKESNSTTSSKSFSEFPQQAQMGFQSMGTVQGEAIVSFYHFVMMLMMCVLGFVM